MQVITTDFDGLLILEPQFFSDERGGFYESWREKDYKACGIKENFLQDNVSISNKNVLRGLHYQANQGQLITVVHGTIFDVVVDIRANSKTFKKYFAIELSNNKLQQIYMPPGFAHGFCVLSDFAVMNYKCTQYYDPSQEIGIIWNDPEIGILWPKKDYIISEKDKLYKVFNEIDS